MKITVYNQQAERVSEIELNPNIFEVKPESHLLAEATRVQLSNARKGLANTKTRGEVSGGGKKPWKQKGTGRARAGSTRGPIWRHGGVAFGPRSSRNWELKLNKKAKTKALFMSLSDKALHKQLIIIDEIKLETPKTKEFVKVLQNFQKNLPDLGKKYLLVVSKLNSGLVRAANNLSNIIPVSASSLNVVDILKADSLLTLQESLPVIEKTYLKQLVNN